MYEGMLVTAVTIGVTFLLGVGVAVFVLTWLWGWRPLQRRAFPFIDEIAATTSLFSASLKTKNPGMPLATRQGLWAIAYAIVAGMTIQALLGLAGQLATPAG